MKAMRMLDDPLCLVQCQEYQAINTMTWLSH